VNRRHLLSLALGGGFAAAGLRGTTPNAIAAAARRGIVDVHAHLAIPGYLALLARGGIRSPGYAGQGRNVPPTSGGQSGDNPEAIAARLRLMDEAGVASQIVSQSLGPYTSDRDLAVQAARLANDRHAALAREHPGRLLGLAVLPLPHVDASLAELRRALDLLGLAGVGLHATSLGKSIADPHFAPLFAEMNRRSGLVCVHPSVNGLMSPLLLDWKLEAAAGPLLEDAVVALQLISGNVPLRYPELRIVIPHLGGGLAAMLDRLDNQLPLAVPGLAARPSEMAQLFWYDSVSHGSKAALRAAVEAFGASRLLPGSDFPVLLAFEPYAETFGYIRKALAPPDAEQILYRNTDRLFGNSPIQKKVVP
jgi:predicted TIM-barrel fold metal-dependent hydrolase